MHCQTEARNDLRPQYTLRGSGFEEFWESTGIIASDTLTFQRDPASGHITVTRTPGSGASASARPSEAQAA